MSVIDNAVLSIIRIWHSLTGSYFRARPSVGLVGQCDYQIVSDGAEVGAGWNHRAETSGRDYVSLSIAAPKSWRVVGGAQSALARDLLARQLANQSAESAFTAEGALSDEAIANSRQIIQGSECTSVVLTGSLRKTLSKRSPDNLIGRGRTDWILLFISVLAACQRGLQPRVPARTAIRGRNDG